MPTFQTFKDLNITFKKHPISDDLIVVKDSAAIKQSISNLLLTKTGERFFQPNLGSRIPGLLFEPLDYGTGSLIEEEIGRVLSLYEPRVKLFNITISPDFVNNGYDVEFDVKILGRDDLISLEVFLERTR